MKKKPEDHFTGLTLEQWQADVSNISWAQQEPRFKMMLSVLLNESQRMPIGNISEGRALGRVEGLHYALEQLRNLGRRPGKGPVEPEATYDERPEKALKPTDVYD